MLRCSRSASWGTLGLKSCRWACRLTAMAEDPTHSAAGHRGLITVFGGTGFLGRRIVRHLLDHGFQVRAASRHPERVGSASRPDAGSETTKADIHDETTVAAALFGAYGAVNAVSLYVERGRETFDAVHVEAAARVARLARENGVERLIHVSGIGADPASSAPYIASRGRGEIAVQQGFPGAILIRPAVMFGPDDAFLTTVVRLLRILPVYPMFGRGETKLQPVYVEDVAEGIARVLAGAGGSAASYEFAGPRVYTYKELVRTVADRIKRSPEARTAAIRAVANSRLGGRVPPRLSSYPQSGSAHAARQYRFRRLSRPIEPGHHADGNRHSRIC